METSSVLINHSFTATRAQTLSSPSASSSPSHDFSFNISFNNYSCPDLHRDKKDTHRQPAAQPRAIDLSPADDIFFRGHLLPLHLQTQLPQQYSSSSPQRSSTDSLDSFTLPITRLVYDEGHAQMRQSQNNSFNISNDNKHVVDIKATTIKLGKSGKIKSSLSLGLKRWGPSKGQDDQAKKTKRKLMIRISHFLSRILIRSSMFSRGNRKIGDHDRLDSDPSGRRVQSLSGNLLCSSRDRSMDLRGRRGELSAPASMRASPNNSGRILGKALVPPRPSDSTMEELQAAIQAAIAHCKDSNIASDQDQQRQSTNELQHR